VHWVIPPQTQDLASPFVELHEAPVGCSGPSEQQHNYVVSSKFCILCKLAEGALYPIKQVINR